MLKLRANPYSRLHWLQAAELLNLLVASRQAAQPTGCKPHDYLPVRRDFKALRPKRTFAGPGAKFPCLFKSAQISSKRFSDACCKAPPGHCPDKTQRPGRTTQCRACPEPIGCRPPITHIGTQGPQCSTMTRSQIARPTRNHQLLAVRRTLFAPGARTWRALAKGELPD